MTLFGALHENRDSHVNILVAHIGRVASKAHFNIRPFQLLDDVAQAVVNRLKRVLWMGLHVETQIRWPPGEAIHARLGELAGMGHRLGHTTDRYGGYQAIARESRTGIYAGASESRKDGCALGY